LSIYNYKDRNRFDVECAEIRIGAGQSRSRRPGRVISGWRPNPHWHRRSMMLDIILINMLGSFIWCAIGCPPTLLRLCQIPYLDSFTAKTVPDALHDRQHTETGGAARSSNLNDTNRPIPR